jgi:hypothetical protein
MHQFQFGSVLRCLLLPARRPVGPARICGASFSASSAGGRIPLALAVVWFLIFGRLDAQTIEVGSEFTYQGRLSESGLPATGKYDLQFRLFVVSSGGLPVGSTLTFNALVVSNGLFTVPLDFGTNIFNGTPYWLEMAVKSNGIASFKTLSPRQPLVATPYALHAVTAGRAAAADSVSSLNLLSVPKTNVVHLKSGLLMLAEGSSTPHLVSVEDFESSLQASAAASPGTLFVDALLGDDGTAIRGRTDRPWRSVSNAIAAAQNGDTVRIRAGRYTNELHYGAAGRTAAAQAILITQTNLTIEGSGPGTELYGEGPGSHIVALDCVGLRLRDFAVLGNKPAGSAGAWYTNGPWAAINITGANTRDVIIERLLIKDHGNHGIGTVQDTNPQEVTIRFCYFENGGATNNIPVLGADGAAISIVGQNWSVHDNVITNWARGVEIYSAAFDIRGAVVSRNRILGAPWEAIISGPENNKSVIGAMITDNVIVGNEEVQLFGGANGITILRNFENGIVSGNVLSRLKGAGIVAHSGWLWRNTFSGNSIFGCGRGISFYDETHSTNVAHNLISHNQIDAIAFQAVAVHGVNNVVSFNQITRFGAKGSEGIGIRFYEGTNIWNAAIGNVIADGAIGISLEGPGVLTNRVFDNHFTRVTTAINDQGTGSIVRDNTQ